ncbi:MAG: adenylosuccinate lyase, partial [Patescibacteria group bacterium]
TAFNLHMKESVNILIDDLMALLIVIREKAYEYKHTPQIGRTHGVHAEPITFGVKLANWYDELKRHVNRLVNLRKNISVGKISGAVGMYTLDPKIEEMVCKRLGLKPIVATQIISRDIVGEYMNTLGLTAASIGKIALNLRLMARTEFREIMEPFSKDQKGSSAMPHKKNPIGSENICGLMRLVCANAQVAYENLANCWDERSLDNSGAERVIVPDSSIALDFAVARLKGTIRDMNVYPERMLKNINETKGLVFSQEVMMLVAEKSSLPREEAHTLIRNVAVSCWDTGEDFLEAILRNGEIRQYVTEEQLHNCFDLKKKLRHVDHIFKMVFGD